MCRTYAFSATLCFFVFAALVVPSAVQAQELRTPEARQGYYIGGGLYGVAASVTDDFDGRFPLWSGGGGAFKLGEMVTDDFGLGLEIGFGVASGKRWQGTLGGLLLSGQWRFLKATSLHVGAGFGTLSAEDTVDSTAEAEGSSGAYYSLGLSHALFPFYDEGESGGFDIAPTIQVQMIPGDSFAPIMVWLGVDLLWWTGLPNNQLELPLDEAFARPE